MKRLFALACAGALIGLTGCATSAPGSSASYSMGGTRAESAWVGAWAGPPMSGGPTGLSLENQTVRQVVRVAAGGQRIRVRLTNEYGEKPITVGAASVALAIPGGVASTTPILLTFGGKSSVTIPRGSPMLSDPIALPVKALESLSISIFLPTATGPCTCHTTATSTNWISPPGDFTLKAFTPASTSTSGLFLSAVDVEPVKPTSVVIALGDSITDGYRSTSDTNRRWPDVLAERLAAKSGYSVVNEGISGNQVLGYGAVRFGDPALARLDRDVISVPGAKWIIVLEGINDLNARHPPAEEMIAGYKQIIERAHAHGIKVIMGTITPFQGGTNSNAAVETARTTINTWIRRGEGFDGIVDFDAAVRDPANPTRMKVDLQSGDWLHPSDAGYKAMGEAVDLALFH